MIRRIVKIIRNLPALLAVLSGLSAEARPFLPDGGMPGNRDVPPQTTALTGAEMTLDEAIAAARTRSVQALEAKQAFISAYWAWRAWQASRLPSLHLYGNLMDFNRSLTLLQNPDDGAMKYVGTHNLQNGLGLQAVQNIAFTGGTLSVSSDLNRIDQFGTDRNLTWYAQPLTVSYRQPLFAYNPFKWDRRIEPKEYEKSRRAYLEAMEEVTVRAVGAYFSLVVARQEEERARNHHRDIRQMCAIAGERLRLGSITRGEYLQLELRLLNDSIAVNETAVRVREEQMELNSLLGFDELYEIVPVLEEDLPDLVMDEAAVADRAFRNSRFGLDNEIALLRAGAAVAKARSERGVTMSLNARFGLSRSGPSLPDAWRNPPDQEVVGLSFSIPIFDWGLGRGRIQKALAAEEVVKAQVQQSENDWRRHICTVVGQLNNQRWQCAVSRRATDIAAERYALVTERFRTGAATVTELNTARAESDAARQQHVTDISNFWHYYYALRQYTLYDFIRGKDLEIDEDEILE